MKIKGTYESGYTVVDNTGSMDKNLSLSAKGLLWMLLTRPNDWKFYISELTNHTSSGKTATQSAVKELEAKGYLKIQRKRDKSGKFTKAEWVINEEPLCSKDEEEQSKNIIIKL